MHHSDPSCAHAQKELATLTQHNWMPELRKGETLTEFQKRAFDEFREAQANLDAKRADAKTAPSERAPFAHNELEAAWAYYEDKAKQVARAVAPFVEIGS